jgi:hypothetical protein
MAHGTHPSQLLDCDMPRTASARSSLNSCCATTRLTLMRLCATNRLTLMRHRSTTKVALVDSWCTWTCRHEMRLCRLLWCLSCIMPAGVTLFPLVIERTCYVEYARCDNMDREDNGEEDDVIHDDRCCSQEMMYLSS